MNKIKDKEREFEAYYTHNQHDQSYTREEQKQYMICAVIFLTNQIWLTHSMFAHDWNNMVNSVLLDVIVSGVIFKFCPISRSLFFESSIWHMPVSNAVSKVVISLALVVSIEGPDHFIRGLFLTYVGLTYLIQINDITKFGQMVKLFLGLGFASILYVNKVAQSLFRNKELKFVSESGFSSFMFGISILNIIFWIKNNIKRKSPSKFNRNLPFLARMIRWFLKLDRSISKLDISNCLTIKSLVDTSDKLSAFGYRVSYSLPYYLSVWLKVLAIFLHLICYLFRDQYPVLRTEKNSIYRFIKIPAKLKKPVPEEFEIDSWLPKVIVDARKLYVKSRPSGSCKKCDHKLLERYGILMRNCFHFCFCMNCLLKKISENRKCPMCNIPFIEVFLIDMDNNELMDRLVYEKT